MADKIFGGVAPQQPHGCVSESHCCGCCRTAFGSSGPPTSDEATELGSGGGLGEDREEDDLISAGATPPLQPPLPKLFERERRALTVLLESKLTSKLVDRTAGCPSGPDLIANLRNAFIMTIPRQRETVLDRDGIAIKRGVYRLAETGKTITRRVLRARQNGSAA